MKTHFRMTLVVMLLILLQGVASAQAANASPEGIDSGAYNYQGSFDLGYRFVNTNGNSSVYNTYVDEQQGPRLLEQTLSMRSLDHNGILFDNLFLSSFGWGGDPENASRLRISKNKWYNFNMTFRRDRNFWDYNLLANPLNPPNAFVNVNDSPHRFETVRRMYDYNLTLLPQSPVRFRLGFSRNNMEGPAFSSLHVGTDARLFQNTRTLLNAYQVGVDIKLLPKTNISYDQFLQYYKGDTSWGDANMFRFQLAPGVPVDSGISWNPAANQPCATPILDATTTPPTMNPACNGFQAYSRIAPTRVSYPTEQLTLQSSYFKYVDLSARGSYSSTESNVGGFSEDFLGLATRSRQRISLTNGPSSSRRVVANADLGITVHVTEKLRVVDTYRFSNFRIPGNWNLLNGSFFAATLLSTANVFSPATCPPPFTAATCPQHNSSSGADVTVDHRSDFLKQESKNNLVELEYDFPRRITGHLGYRYEAREVTNNQFDTADLTFYPTLANRGACVGLPVDANGICSTTAVDNGSDVIPIHSHAVIAGVAAHPVDALRLSFDTELLSADRSLTRISPRNLQRYKARVNYKAKDWINISGTMNILESRNNVSDVLHREHNRNYGFTLALNPKPAFGFEFGYNYDDIFSTTNICYVITSTPPPNSTLCAGGPLIAAVSIYDNKVNFGYINVVVRPVKRVTLDAGYNLTSTSGNTLILTPIQNTLGPLAFNFHKPTALLEVELAKGWSWRTAWNYYDYNEKSSPGLLIPRDFQSNSATLSVRYSF